MDTTKPEPTPRRGGGGQRADTDFDGYTDFNELRIGSDPYDPCDPDPKCAACLALEAVAEVIEAQEPTTTAPTPPKEDGPGFEVLFAIAGLLAVAYLVQRRK